MPSEHTHRGAKRAREARAALRLASGPLPDLLTAIERRAGAHLHHQAGRRRDVGTAKRSKRGAASQNP